MKSPKKRSKTSIKENLSKLSAKKKMIAGAFTGLALIICAGGAYALFSARAAQKNNAFSIVVGEKDQDGGIEIIEPKWNPDDPEHKDMEPGQITTKDPYVQSNVAYDGWIVIKVSVPKVLSKMEKDDPLSYIEAVYTLCADASGNLPADVSEHQFNNNDFTLLATEHIDDNTADSANYYFGFNDIVPGFGKTTNIFDGIQIRDFEAVTPSSEKDTDTSISGVIDLNAMIVQSINPETGVPYKNVSDAFVNGMNSSF